MPTPAETGERNPRREAGNRKRRRSFYLALMGACAVLFVLAWALVRTYSMTATVVMTAVAIILPLVAVFAANAGSPINRRRAR